MPIEMPRELPFSVDTWTPISNRKRHHFLTHAHKDHCSGILTHSSYPIYCTTLTKLLVLHHFPQLEDSMFVDVEVGRAMVIDDPWGQFTVTAFDANHCPGAVMFLFEGNFSNILHTGDCRLTPECLQYFPEQYITKKGKKPRCQLDYVFLDCTFGRFHQKLPSKSSATQQVIDCIWKHPAATVIYLTCDLLGQENILAEVSQTFGSKIYVDRAASPECFQALTLTVPQIVSQDPSSRFHLFDGFPKLSERAAAKFAEAEANSMPEPLIIRPSAQWYACEEEDSSTESHRKRRFNEAVRDGSGMWHVCYSMHSSREELEWALQLLAPKWVMSTTPSCRAMELDYVKKQCLGTWLNKDDPIWKLLDIGVEASAEVDVSASVTHYSPIIEGPSHFSAASTQQPEKLSHSQLQSLSPPSKMPAVTLFGRARLCNEGSNFPLQEKLASIKDKLSSAIDKKVDQEFPAEVDAEVKCENILEDNRATNVATGHDKNSVQKETHKLGQFSSIGSSRNFSDPLRKLYRSMNVPVPRPLPSLVELNGSNTQNKRI